MQTPIIVINRATHDLAKALRISLTGTWSFLRVRSFCLTFNRLLALVILTIFVMLLTKQFTILDLQVHVAGDHFHLVDFHL